MSFGWGSEARLDWVAGTDSFALRVFRREADGMISATVLDSVDETGQPVFRSEKFTQGQIIPPLLLLPGDVAQSIQRQFGDKTNSAEIAKHRDDAIEVRDRLLSMLERGPS